MSGSNGPAPSDVEALLAEAEDAPIEGWDFTWLAGRATEERPSWGYATALAERLAAVEASLDLETGGGEVLDRAAVLPPLAVATESWPPNLATASARLAPRSVAVVRTEEGAPLPFADGVFDLVSSRHPVAPQWSEIARVLRPGGRYFAQHVGPASVFELVEFFLGRQSASTRRRRHPDDETRAAVSAGLRPIEVRSETLRVAFADVGAVAWFLRKVVWLVPDFAVHAHRERLLELHRLIGRDGEFVAHSTRTLFELERSA